MDEVRLALRRLTKRPAATFASIATLACAIGAAAVTWSTISAVLLNPLPIRHPEQVVIVSTMATTGPAAGTLHSGAMYPYYPYIRSSGIFEGVAAGWSPMALLTETGGSAPERAQVAFVTHDYFDLLGVAIPRGRGFHPDDDRRGSAPVAVLSDRYWHRIWGRDPAAIGRTMVINKIAVTIVGIAVPGFRGLSLAQAPDIWLPFHVIPEVGGGWTNYLADLNHQSSPTSGMTIVARLAAGITSAQATARLATLPSPADERLRGTLAISPVNVEALPLASRASVAQFSRMLAATVGLLLFIGCTTVGLLLLLRTEARREEFAMCLALGASRGRLARGVAHEGFVLALGGALLALPVALWLFELVQAYQLPGGVAIELLDLSRDGAVLAAAGAAAVAAVLLISLIAGVFGFRADLADALRARAGATPRVDVPARRRVGEITACACRPCGR